MSISSNLRLSFCAALTGSLLVAAATAQVIPNPLMRPNRASGAQPAAPATTDPQARGATAAPSQSRAGARGQEGEGLPAEDVREQTVAEQLSKLYVSAVIGDRAVLRSVEVLQVPGLPANTGGGGARGAGAAGGGGSGGGGGNAGGAGAVGGGGLRSQIYVVRNGEVLPFLDKLRLLVRVRDSSVTLFDVTDIPPGNYDPLDLMDRGFPVAFRGSVDSVQSLPPTPPELIAPGAGVDGAAFERGRRTTVGGNSGNSSSGAAGSTGSTGGTGGTGNP